MQMHKYKHFQYKSVIPDEIVESKGPTRNVQQPPC
jgi:hypothetical protein